MRQKYPFIFTIIAVLFFAGCANKGRSFQGDIVEEQFAKTLDKDFNGVLSVGAFLARPSTGQSKHDSIVRFDAKVVTSKELWFTGDYQVNGDFDWDISDSMKYFTQDPSSLDIVKNKHHKVIHFAVGDTLELWEGKTVFTSNGDNKWNVLFSQMPWLNSRQLKNTSHWMSK